MWAPCFIPPQGKQTADSLIRWVGGTFQCGCWCAQVRAGTPRSTPRHTTPSGLVEQARGAPKEAAACFALAEELLRAAGARSPCSCARMHRGVLRMEGPDAWDTLTSQDLRFTVTSEDAPEKSGSLPNRSSFHPSTVNRLKRAQLTWLMWLRDMPMQVRRRQRGSEFMAGARRRCGANGPADARAPEQGARAGARRRPRGGGRGVRAAWKPPGSCGAGPRPGCATRTRSLAAAQPPGRRRLCSARSRMIPLSRSGRGTPHTLQD